TPFPTPRSSDLTTTAARSVKLLTSSAKEAEMAPERTYERARVIPSHAPATRLVSSVQNAAANPTELRVDYKDLVAGQLVIVIDGLPTADRDAVAPSKAGPRAPVATGSSHSRGRVSPS